MAVRMADWVLLREGALQVMTPHKSHVPTLVLADTSVEMIGKDMAA